MNLLPKEVIDVRQRKKLLFMMVAIQAAIFLLIILIVGALDFSITLRQRSLYVLKLETQNERFAESEAAATALRNFLAENVMQSEAVYWLELKEFCTERFEILRGTLPSESSLVNVYMGDNGASVTVKAPNLHFSDIHRDKLMLTGLAYHVQLTSAMIVEDDQVRYVLAIRWNEEGRQP